MTTNKVELDETTQAPPQPQTTRCNALNGYRVRHPDLKISGVRFNLMKLPCVYAWIRGERWMYVGASSRGMGRPLDYSHHVMRTLAPEDTLLVWRFKKKENALRFEEQLIRAKRPRLNSAGKPQEIKGTKKNEKQQVMYCAKCGQAFYGNREWQRFCSKMCRWQDWNDDHPSQGERIIISLDDPD